MSPHASRQRTYQLLLRGDGQMRPTSRALAGEHRCDVVVVGGGFTGVSAMLHLAERGYDVVLLEANRIGWGASGRNGGQLIDGFVEEDRIEKRFGSGCRQSRL